jgi:enamine deaminase RidA (YjgF/YER057c/UK114 family)
MSKSYHAFHAGDWQAGQPSSAAVRAGDLLFVAGQVGLDDAGRPVAADAAGQARAALGRVKAAVEAAGGSLADVIDVMSFHRDPREIDEVLAVAREVLGDNRPAWTAVGSSGLQRPDIAVSVRALAHLGADEKICVATPACAWMDGLPMSAACRKGDIMVTSGLLALDPAGMVVAPGEHYAQVRYCYDRLKEVIAAGGGQLNDVIDVICFNHDFRGMEATVSTWCAEIVPNIATAQANAYTLIATTGLMRHGLVGAYRAILDLSDGPRVATNLPSVHWHAEPIAGATRKKGGRLVAISGQVASDGDANIVARGDVAAQAHYCFSQIRGVLEKHGASLADVVEIVSYHKDPRAWETVMAVGRELFKEGAEPAWTTVGCTGLFLEGYLHEIYAMAVLDD